MAFVHGKNAQFALRDTSNTWRDMTAFTSEVTVPGKSGLADTTVFGKGAKTWINGLMEGTLTVKGFWDPTTTTGPDAVFAGLLGTQATTGLTVVAQVTAQSNYGQFILCPAGSTTGLAVLGDCVLADYQVLAPVANVVSFQATFNLSGATTATATLNGGTTTGAYGLQVIRAATSVVFNTAWIAAAGGAATYAALMSTTK